MKVDYVLVYVDQWWIGIVKNNSDENNDILVVVWKGVKLTTMAGRPHNISGELCNEISSLFSTMRRI